MYEWVKFFFDFLINIEDIEMKNPMRNYVTKACTRNTESVTKEEFESILYAVDNHDPIYSGWKGERKNMYKPYLKWGFRLFLTGDGVKK
jgi:integrase